MRQSNVCSPVQNQACLLITSRLYDRRGLDCTSPLPLFNSLAHLVHLTATSPKIREILTRDGGLERLVRILRDFCVNPPPAQDPALFYGLLPPWSGEDEAPALVPGRPVDREAAQRFSLAFQSIVNIGVRGSEAVRTRVVQAGTLEVVAALLETWLLAKGFPLALPPRRQKKKQSNTPRPQPESIIVVEDDQSQEIASNSQPQAFPVRTTRSVAITPRPRPSSPRPAPHVMPVALPPPQQPPSRVSVENHAPSTVTPTTISALPTPIPTPIDTPTPSSIGSPPAVQATTTQARGRSGTILPRRQADDSRDESLDPRDHSGQNTEDSDAEMDAVAGDLAAERSMPRPVAVADPGPDMDTRRGDMEVDVMAAVNMVMTVDGAEVFAGTQFGGDAANAAAAAAAAAATVAGTMPDETPRAVLRTIADATGENADIVENARNPAPGAAGGAPASQPAPPGAAATAMNSTRHRIRIVAGDAGPFRQEDVLRALQLLAYLTKYPHVRQEFYKQRVAPSPPPWLQLAPNAPPLPSPQTPTTLFSLVERFTFRPSLSQFSQHPGLIIPTIPPEIQSWAAVIMRNACRKDESRGGIRQCANMLCGKWESAPREFAKCRRCRKAKYCGKECQSQAWSMGHRYWCSARDGEEGEGEHAGEDAEARRAAAAAAAATVGGVPAPTTASAATAAPRAPIQPTTTRHHQPQPQPQPDSIPSSFPMQRNVPQQSTTGPNGVTPPATAAAAASSAQRRGTGGRIARSLGDTLARALRDAPGSNNSHQRQQSLGQQGPTAPVLPPVPAQPPPTHNPFSAHLMPFRLTGHGANPNTGPNSVAEHPNEAGPSTSRANRWSTLLSNLPGRQGSGSRSNSGSAATPSSAVLASLPLRTAVGNGQQRHDSYSDFQSAMSNMLSGGAGLRRSTVEGSGAGSASDLSGMVRSSLVIQSQGQTPVQAQAPAVGDRRALDPQHQQHATITQQRFRLSAFRPETDRASPTPMAPVPDPNTTHSTIPPVLATNATLYPPNPPWLRSREAGNESQDVEMGWVDGEP